MKYVAMETRMVIEISLFQNFLCRINHLADFMKLDENVNPAEFNILFCVLGMIQ